MTQGLPASRIGGRRWRAKRPESFEEACRRYLCYLVHAEGSSKASDGASLTVGLTVRNGSVDGADPTRTPALLRAE